MAYNLWPGGVLLILFLRSDAREAAQTDDAARQACGWARRKEHRDWRSELGHDVVGPPSVDSTTVGGVPSWAVGPSVIRAVENEGLLGDGPDAAMIMYSHPEQEDGWVSKALQSGKWYDPSWRELCRLYDGAKGKGLTFLDVGANVGNFAVPMARCMKRRGGKVVAVEALPRHSEILKANMRINFVEGSVNLFPYAVGDVAGGQLTIALNGANLGASSAVNCGRNATPHIAAPLTTLDDIYAVAPELMHKVLVMKIDIEGSEGRALYGAQKFLAESPPCYLRIELMQEWLRRARTPLSELLAYLRTKGYDVDGQRRVSFLDHDFVFSQKRLHECIDGKHVDHKD